MNKPLQLTLIGTLTLSIAGCGNYVSEEEYLRTSLRPVDRQTYGYIEPAPTVDMRPVRPASEREVDGVLLTDPGENLSDDEWEELQERDRALATPTVTVRARMEALDREMSRLGARADLRGPAARSAFEDHARDFNLTKRMIAERVGLMRADPEVTDFERAEIESLVDEAAYTVQRARNAVFSTPPQPR